MDNYAIIGEYFLRFGPFPAALLNTNNDEAIITTLKFCLQEGRPAE